MPVVVVESPAKAKTINKYLVIFNPGSAGNVRQRLQRRLNPAMFAAQAVKGHRPDPARPQKLQPQHRILVPAKGAVQRLCGKLSKTHDGDSPIQTVTKLAQQKLTKREFHHPASAGLTPSQLDLSNLPAETLKLAR